MKNNKSVIIFSIIIILLIALFTIVSINKNKISVIDYSDIESVVSKDDHVFIYTGEINDEIKAYARLLRENFRGVIYNVSLSDDQTKELGKKVEIDGDGYLVYSEGNLAGFVSSKMEDDKKDEYVKKYLFGYIPSDERYYQVLGTAEEYIKKFNSNEYTIAVFGYTNCSFCTLYLPVVNKVSKDYKLDIYYFDRDTYDKVEYQKVMDLDFEIPGECTVSGEPTTLGGKFDKPLTAITKNGELKGCIKGYVTEDVLVGKLKELKVLKGVK